MANQVTSAPAIGEAQTIIPPADILETKDALIMLLDMPGADPESLDVVLEKNDLTISARSTPFMPEHSTLVHREYPTGNYERAFTLSSEDIDNEHLDAIFKDGVLRLTLPKAKQASAKKIAVRSA